MDFVRQLEDIFGIDVWELKPEYRFTQQIETQTITEKLVDVEPSGKNLEIVYTNEVDSSKIINILLTDKLDISFLKQIVTNLFFKSNVCIYKTNNINSFYSLEGVNLAENDFISNDYKLLDIQNKKQYYQTYISMQILELDITFLTKTIQLVRAIDKDFSWSDKQIEDSLTNDTVLGLMIDSELVAIAIFNYIFETAELLYICVDTAMQSRGVASKLLKYSIDHLGKKEVKELFLEVDINNTKAISLYNKLNFIKVSQRKNYYKKIDGSLSNALICRLDISN